MTMQTGLLRTLGCGLASHALVLYLAAPAHAQIVAPREAALLEIGPLSIYPSVRLFDVGIDENVFNDPERPKLDHTFTLGSNVLGLVRFGSNELLVQSGGDYVWFREYASERYTGGRHSIRLNLAASRFKPFLGAVYNRTRARRGREIDARAGWVDRSALGGFAFDVTDRTSITASARIEDTRYEEGEQFRGVDLANALNRTGRSFSGGVRYAITPFTSLHVAADYAEDEFPLSHLRDSKSYSFVPALEFSPDAAIRGRVMAGFQVFKPVDTNLPEYQGSVLAAAVNWSVHSRTTLDIIGTRSVNYSYHPTQPYYLLTGVRAAVNQHLFGPVDVQVGSDWEHLSYRWQYGMALATEDYPTDTTRIVFGGFRVTFRQGISMSITAERTARLSNQDSRQDFKRMRLLSSFTVGS